MQAWRLNIQPKFNVNRSAIYAFDQKKEKKKERKEEKRKENNILTQVKLGMR